jgi:predicted nucleic acid-binding protein
VTGSASGGTPRLLRLCLDLNIWCAALISRRRGRRIGSSQALVDIAQEGMCPAGAVQLVISWAMLDRLGLVLQRDLGADPQIVAILLRDIAHFAAEGPAAEPPYALLGGAGVVAVRDAEDAHVLDVALAGGAHLLATANLADFSNYRTEALFRGRVLLHEAASRQPLVIAHPDEAAAWLQSGVFPDPTLVRSQTSPTAR